MKLLHEGNHTLNILRRRNLDFPLHLHNALELALLTEGRSTVLCDGQRTVMSAGDLFLTFPNQVHGYEDSRDNRGFTMIIPMNPYLTEFRSVMEQQVPANPLLHWEQWGNTGVLQLVEMALEDQAAASAAVMQGYVLLIVGKLLPLLTLRDASRDNTNALQSILMFLNDHYREPLSRQDIAAAVGYNESYISHIFSDTLHTTLTDYVASLRMEDAVPLLINSPMTISQIAVTLGFGSIRSFNRVFLSRAGVSPSAYRAAARSGKGLPAGLPG